MATNDPMQSAIEPPTAFSNDLYGKIEVTAQYMYTAKSEKPRPFVEGEDDPRRRSTEVALSLTTIDAQGLTRPVIERKHLTWTPVWGGIWESIQALGCENLHAINGKFVKVEMVPTGRTYTSKQDGSERDEKAMKFVALYANEAACVAAYEDSVGVSQEVDDKRAAEWRPKIEVYVEVTNGDLKALEARLTKAGSPFGIDSALVIDVLKAQAEAVAA